ALIQYEPPTRKDSQCRHHAKNEVRTEHSSATFAFLGRGNRVHRSHKWSKCAKSKFATQLLQGIPSAFTCSKMFGLTSQRCWNRYPEIGGWPLPVVGSSRFACKTY